MSSRPSLIAALVALLAATPAWADPASPASTWSGAYIGGHIGTGQISGHVSNPVGDMVGAPYLFRYGDKIAAPAGAIGIQAGYTWAIPNSNWLFGIEGELSVIDARGANTCLSIDSVNASSNCQLQSHASATLTSRFGTMLGPDQRTFLYGKLGAGLLDVRSIQTFAYSGMFAVEQETSKHLVDPAVVVGFGAEYALTPEWSAKIEYEHFFLASYTQQTFYKSGGVDPIYSRSTGGYDTLHLGVNYHFNAQPAAWWSDKPAPTPANIGWTIEVGTRYWYSIGKFQKDLAPYGQSARTLGNRLSYTNTGSTGEIFGRLDTPMNVFLKANAGIGGLPSGNLHNEGWYGAPYYYSNTESSLRGSLNYLNIDLGYDLLRRDGNRLGAFVGYSYIYDRQNAHGCTQLATAIPGCVTAPGELVNTDTDRWHAMRLGLAADLAVTDRLRLSVDAAYLPFVSFNGVDQDVVNGLTITGKGHGQGTQLELIASYALTDRFSVGVGGRYWAAWVDTGSSSIDGLPGYYSNGAYRMQRYGAFLQGSYKFN